MRRPLLFALAIFLVCLVSGLLFAQGYSGSSRHLSLDPKKPLPLTLPDAYVIAVKRIGAATNRFHCVTATCLDATNQWSTGWTFSFSNTNSGQVTVKVFFNKEIWIDMNSSALLNH